MQLSSLNLLNALMSEVNVEQRKLIKVEEEHYGFQHYWILTYDNGEQVIRYHYSREWDDL